MSNLIQKNIDRFWTLTLFRILPRGFSPNYFTVSRLILILIILYFAARGNFVLVLVLFLTAAVADTLDGSLARARGLTSSFGLMLDPLADKLLIILLIFFLAYYYPYDFLLLLVIMFDLLLLLAGAMFLLVRKNKGLLPSDWLGKTKMFLQVVAVLAIIFYLIFSSPWLLYLSIVLLILAIFFSLASVVSYGIKVIIINQ